MQHRMLERLVFFSDAVFAIAITLLVIEIGIPHIAHDGDATTAAMNALLSRSPKILGFAISFLVIGAFWAAHHRVFGMIDQHDPSLVWPNLHLLMMIAFLPFATGFMSENPTVQLPNIFYSVCLILVALLQIRLFRLALKPGNRAAGVTEAQVAAVHRRSLAVPISAVVAILGTLFWQGWAMLAFLLVPVLARTLGREHRAPVQRRDES